MPENAKVTALTAFGVEIAAALVAEARRRPVESVAIIGESTIGFLDLSQL